MDAVKQEGGVTMSTCTAELHGDKIGRDVRNLRTHVMVRSPPLVPIVMDIHNAYYTVLHKYQIVV